MLLCSIKTLGEMAHRHGVNNIDIRDQVEKQVQFSLERGKALYTLHPPREGEQQLCSHHHGSLWLVWVIFSYYSVAVFGSLGRSRLVRGEINTLPAQVFIPGHSQTPFVWSCLLHSLFLPFALKYILLDPNVDPPTFITISYTSDIMCHFSFLFNRYLFW